MSGSTDFIALSNFEKNILKELVKADYPANLSKKLKIAQFSVGRTLKRLESEGIVIRLSKAGEKPQYFQASARAIQILNEVAPIAETKVN